MYHHIRADPAVSLILRARGGAQPACRGSHGGRCVKRPEFLWEVVVEGKVDVFTVR